MSSVGKRVPDPISSDSVIGSVEVESVNNVVTFLLSSNLTLSVIGDTPEVYLASVVDSDSKVDGRVSNDVTSGTCVDGVCFCVDRSSGCVPTGPTTGVLVS